MRFMFIRTLPVFVITRSFDVVYSSFVTLSLRTPSKWKTKKIKEIKLSCTCHEDVGYRGNRGKAPVILNVGTRRRWLIYFMSRQIYHLDDWFTSRHGRFTTLKDLRYPLNQRRIMTKTRSGRFVEEEQPFICLALMTTFIAILRIALPTVRDTLELRHMSEPGFFFHSRGKDI